VVELARAEGTQLADDVIDRQVAFAQTLPAGSYSSLHHDLITDHRMELDALHGAVLRRAAQHGVSVPACTAIYAVLAPWARRNEIG
jgi:2-dehydropantoate 2-reductase